MRRVLMISPHFPPDASAASHRVRILAPHLPAHGWTPTVLAVDPRDVEGRLDPDLAALVPAGLRVVRCRAWPARASRVLGVGDLGLRALPGLLRAASALLRREPFDAVLVTIYPTYPALLGPVLKRRFGVRFVLDYQDPWVGAWGQCVGPGPGGRPDLKSRLSRALATRLEPRAARAADAIVAVSAETYEAVRRRHPALRATPCAAIPIGAEPADIEHVRRRARPATFFAPGDGRVHVASVGTLLPLGMETLRAVLAALALVRARRPDLGERLRLHFIGTGNQSGGDPPERVRPVARALGVDDAVTEVARRVPYLDALAAQVDASALLMMGSSERHYTASRLYPGLLARRPILAVYHADSSAVEALRRVAAPPAARVITHDDATRAGARVEAIAAALEAVAACPRFDARAVDEAALAEYAAPALAGRLAAVLDAACARR